MAKRETRNAVIITYGVDFNLTNRQNSSTSRKPNINVTTIHGDIFVTGNPHGFSAYSGDSCLPVDYFLVWNISWNHVARCAKPYHKAVQMITIWKWQSGGDISRKWFTVQCNKKEWKLRLWNRIWQNKVHYSCVRVNKTTWREIERANNKEKLGNVQGS